MRDRCRLAPRTEYLIQESDRGALAASMLAAILAVRIALDFHRLEPWLGNRFVYFPGPSYQKKETPPARLPKQALTGKAKGQGFKGLDRRPSVREPRAT